MESINNVSSAPPSILYVLMMHEDEVIMSFLDKKLYVCIHKVDMVDKVLHAVWIIKEKASIIDTIICEVVEMNDKVVQDFVGQIRSFVNIPVKFVSSDSYEAKVLKCISDVCIYTLKGPTQYIVEKRHSKLEHDYRSSGDIVNKNTVLTERLDKRPKRQRVIWTPELHQAFVDALHKLGSAKAVPKKILETMNKPELTRENVASHLQKYRLYLKKQQNVTHVQQIGRRRRKSTSNTVDSIVAANTLTPTGLIEPVMSNSSSQTFSEDITNLNGMQLSSYTCDKIDQCFDPDTQSFVGHDPFKNDASYGWEQGLHYPTKHVDVGLMNQSLDHGFLIERNLLRDEVPEYYLWPESEAVNSVVLNQNLNTLMHQSYPNAYNNKSNGGR